VIGANRLFFAPTGRTLPAGVSELGGYLIVAPYIGHAFHDRFMIAVGTPLLTESFARYWYVAPKVGLIAAPLWNVALGGLLIADAGVNPLSGTDGEPNVAESFVWGVVTYGGPKAAVTVGAASDVGTMQRLPDGGVLILGVEYGAIGNSGAPRRPALRFIAESYWPLPGSEASPLDISLTFVGVRFRAARVAFEVVQGIGVEYGRVKPFRFPLFHVSFLF
jgi:hypothetical protein